YACLSYVWGPTDPPPQPPLVLTTRETLSLHQRSIPFYSLPQTLRDAISFVRGLGLRYIWIDALCIVQDDNADWLRECSRMRLIFANSRLTLAA
ncbi:hypothetical protein AOQ84DRAFT_269873, partial [Glonium stellatum]